MANVGQFAQHLLRHDPQRDPARATLHNFVRHLLDPSLPFTPAVIATFYARVLQFDHWQSEARHLAAVVRAEVSGFLAHVGEDAGAFATLRHSDTLQVIRLRVTEDIAEIIQTEHEARLRSGAQIKMVTLGDQSTLVLLLATTGVLEAKVYPHLALVWGPRLRPVAPTTQLFYGADLELTPGIRQLIEGSLLATYAFHVADGGAHGLVVRGHTFQKFETFACPHVPENAELFAALKKMERHFIEPQSDPYYQDLITRLERANQAVARANAAGVMQIERALNKGRVALKSVFPNDRLLALLVNHLELGLAQREAPVPPRPVFSVEARG